MGKEERQRLLIGAITLLLSGSFSNQIHVAISTTRTGLVLVTGKMP